MSRSGYTEDCDHEDGRHAMYRGQVASATRGKRGQALLRDLMVALDEMPVKSLISGALRAEGEVCALGCLGAKRGFDLEAIDPEDYDYIAQAFGVAHQLVREIEFMNDDAAAWSGSGEERWRFMRQWVESQIINR